MTQASKQGIPESDANVSWVRPFVIQGPSYPGVNVSQRGSAAVLRVAACLVFTAASLSTVVKGCLAPVLYTLGARRILGC